MTALNIRGIEMNKILRVFFLIGFGLSGSLTLASIKNVNPTKKVFCKTPRGKRQFTLTANKVIFGPLKKVNNRKLASTAIIRESIESKGVNKIVLFEGHKYSIHIEDLKNFDQVNDYLIIRSKEGHEITYPIHCQRLSK